jgi:hypothetical protein
VHGEDVVETLPVSVLSKKGSINLQGLLINWEKNSNTLMFFVFLRSAFDDANTG